MRNFTQSFDYLESDKLKLQLFINKFEKFIQIDSELGEYISQYEQTILTYNDSFKFNNVTEAEILFYIERY